VKIASESVGSLDAYGHTRANAHNLMNTMSKSRAFWYRYLDCKAYKSCNNECIVDPNSSPQSTFCDQPCEHRQCRCNQKDPSDDVDERPEVVFRSRPPRTEMARRSNIRQDRHRIVGRSESLRMSFQCDRSVVNRIYPPCQNREAKHKCANVKMAIQTLHTQQAESTWHAAM
jgi:hypothetical protein